MVHRWSRRNYATLITVSTIDRDYKLHTATETSNQLGQNKCGCDRWAFPIFVEAMSEFIYQSSWERGGRQLNPFTALKNALAERDRRRA